MIRAYHKNNKHQSTIYLTRDECAKNYTTDTVTLYYELPVGEYVNVVFNIKRYHST